MIANNIFRAIGDFFTNVGFKPMDWIRNDISSWWTQNTISWIFVIISMVAFVYWMGQLKQFKQQGTE
ncbi:DUF6341 family protein [Urechidicola croceus]|uniref:Uracil phosphoribosyltransferase n=1 Tax=Urechidicola croceus TaxID=1850246 RepID=A0A1D8PA40_9FLAO|nr:hypothetical protein [Urechidicola croceus]AOW21371.1 hypothetical protein LPB138_12080 [Urechidicola croceus]